MRIVSILRRLWWATLPFYGWTGYDGEDGAVPCPWWAHPLSWVHRLIDWAAFRNRDVFGPLTTMYGSRTSRPRGLKPWQ